jgi:hypothetical protein
MKQVFYLDVAYVYNGFKCFSGVLQVFQTHVSKISFVFRHMLQLLYLDVSKLDRVSHLSLRLSVVSPWCHTGAGGPHMLAGGHNRRDMGEQTRGRGSGAGVRALATP